MVVEGYGILQPRIGISIQSASRSRLAAIYSGQTGFDIYTRAVSDVYQDLFGEGIFTGKGIYEVDAFREVLEQRFPENALLSHDLIEGAYARVALVTDIELIDDYPSHFSAYNRRKHRWVRGDWQIMRWLLVTRARLTRANLIPNPISLISRWKILDNLRRSLLEPGIAAAVARGWFLLPGAPGYWTAGDRSAMLFLPVYSISCSALARVPWGRRGVHRMGAGHGRAFRQRSHYRAAQLVFLLHQALLSVDAITRSILRVFVTKRKLLRVGDRGGGRNRAAAAVSHRGRVPRVDALAGRARRSGRLARASCRFARCRPHSGVMVGIARHLRLAEPARRARLIANSRGGHAPGCANRPSASAGSSATGVRTAPTG